MNRIRQLRIVCLELASSTDQFHSMELASSRKNFQVKTGVRTASLAERRAASHPLTLSPRPRVLLWRLLLSFHSLPFSPRPLVLVWRLLSSHPLYSSRAPTFSFGASSSLPTPFTPPALPRPLLAPPPLLLPYPPTLPARVRPPLWTLAPLSPRSPRSRRSRRRRPPRPPPRRARRASRHADRSDLSCQGGREHS